jgi:hypothetical protein
VNIPSYVGIHDPDQPGQVRLRYVHNDGNPWYMIKTLRKIWAGAAARDTNRLITLLLAQDWDDLDPDTTDSGTSSPPTGRQPIPGVGMTLAATNGDGQILPPRPVTVVALTAVADLGVLFIYLLDPRTDTVIAHYRTGEVAHTRPLAS